MYDIEPYFNWQNLYIASEDERSPFYGREYSEFEFTNHIYDFVIHPQWDNIGSPTLFLKILYVDYDEGFSVIELFGEWNDCINNDIMYLKREVIESMLGNGVNKFIIVGENILNFHASDDCYYEEWSEELDGGWIAMVNFQSHVLKEFESEHIDQYFVVNDSFSDFSWRTFRPLQLFQKVEQIIERPKYIQRQQPASQQL